MPHRKSIFHDYLFCRNIAFTAIQNQPLQFPEDIRNQTQTKQKRTVSLFKPLTLNQELSDSNSTSIMASQRRRPNAAEERQQIEALLASLTDTVLGLDDEPAIEERRVLRLHDQQRNVVLSNLQRENPMLNRMLQEEDIRQRENDSLRAERQRADYSNVYPHWATRQLEMASTPRRRVDQRPRRPLVRLPSPRVSIEEILDRRFYAQIIGTLTSRVQENEPTEDTNTES
jgi:hypothetical protein